MKAIIYCRVSTKEQEDSGYSLPAQEKLLTDYSKKKDFEIAKIFSVSESASGKSMRKNFAEMLNYATKNSISVLVFEKVDRVTRNFKECVLIDEWINQNEERQIHLVKNGLVIHKDSKSQDVLIWDMNVVIAKNQIRNLSEEVKKGQKEKIASGWYPSAPPLGYTSIGEKGRRKHILDKVKAPLIAKVFELYATGVYSTEKVADLMVKKGLRSKNGKELNKRRIYEILTNPYYTGWFKWNGRLYKGNQEAIISKELFDKVQSILTGRGIPHISKKDFTYKGVIKCKQCGRLVSWEEHKKHWYGHCNYDKSGCSDRDWIREKVVDDKIAEVIEQLTLSNPRITEWVKASLLESHQDEMALRESKQKELESSYEIVNRKLDKLYDDRLGGFIQEDTYQKKFEELSNEKSYILNEIEQLSNKADDYKQKGIGIFNFSQSLKDKYHKKQPNDKKILLKKLCSNIQKLGTSIELELNKDYADLLIAVKKTNGSRIPAFEKNSGEILEPVNFGSRKQKTDSLEPVCAIWRPGPGSNRRPPP
jgi:site-specific DNA recombinase